MTTILDALDQLRMAALRGDADAAERAKQIADRLEQAAVPAQFLRRARLLALESEGYVLRREIDTPIGIRLVDPVWMRDEEHEGRIEVSEGGNVAVLQGQQVLVSFQP